MEDAKSMRHFCKICGCHLWAWAPSYAEFCYPMAPAIDTDLQKPPARCVLRRPLRKSCVVYTMDITLDRMIGSASCYGSRCVDRLSCVANDPYII